jgi:hypothetical protein
MKRPLDLKREDRIFTEAHPAMNDSVHRTETMQAVFELAKEEGISREKMMEAYNKGDPTVRSAVAQAQWYRRARERVDQRKDHGGDLSVRQASRLLSRRRGTT